MRMAKVSSFRLGALFLLSMAMVGYELAVMRCFSVGSWSNFGSMVISIALLGGGIAGTLLTLLEDKVAASPDRWLKASAFCLAPAMALAHVGAQYLPFNPVMITTDRSQALWLAGFYLLYSLPFLVGSIYVGSAFIAFKSRIHALYFWNMLGSGLGGFLVLALLYVLPPARLMGPLTALASLAALLALVDPGEGGPRLKPESALAAATALAASLLALIALGDLRTSEFKSVSYARDFPDSRLVYRDFGPTGDFEVYGSSFFHMAPGLSDNASSALATMPKDAYLGLYIDGDGPIGVMRRLRSDEAGYFDYLPIAAPYAILKSPKVLELRLGGGIGVQAALQHKASSVTVVEPDPALLGMMRDEPFFRAYTGKLLDDPRVRAIGTEPRAFALSTAEKFDLVEIGLVDSVGLSQTGGNPVTENFLYTAEGLASFLSTLRPGGILSITVWNRLTPPRNVPKLLSTVAEALRLRGDSSPETEVFAFDQLLSTATVLVKRGGFTPAEILALRGFCERMSFLPFYYPGMAGPAIARSELLAGYADRLLGAPKEASTKGPEEAKAGDFLQEDLYYYVLDSLFKGEGDPLYSAYPFSIGPATDDKPYYTAYVKPETLRAVAADIRDLSEEWGWLLLVVTLGISLFFGLVIILLPLAARGRELFSRGKGTLRVIGYFACLGLGYMFIEIFLIQRLTFFLVDPVFANSIVITAMLLASGLGSLVAGSSRRPRRKLVRAAVLGIVLSCVFYALGLTPLLNALLGLGLGLKIAIAVAVVALSAFCLGMPFPTGLTALSATRPVLVPWAWGVNAALSVTGSLLARLVSVETGFASVLLVAALLYGLAASVWIGKGTEEPRGA